ncbi:unnamed protein product [Parnassius apollo]|uniref:(apollo) hypothetical protein n=1 Tax=Parnassius apollo TaxID=110799 RepID=A0A8S3WWZ7_PARAO|nr:unnamed protein product [Parnassius apollo]
MNDSNETQENIMSRDSDHSAPSTNKIFKSPNKLQRRKSNTFDQRAEEAYNNMQEALKKRRDRDQSTTFGEHVANKHRSYTVRVQARSDSTTPTSPFPVEQQPSRTPTPTMTSFTVHQLSSRTPTPTLPSISSTSTLMSPYQYQISRTSILNLPTNQSISSTALLNFQGQGPQLVKYSKQSSSGSCGSRSGPKKVTVLRSLIVKRSKNNLQNIPPNEQHLSPEEKYISPEEQNVVPRIDPSFIQDDFTDISQEGNTDHIVSFSNNFIPE